MYQNNVLTSVLREHPDLANDWRDVLDICGESLALAEVVEQVLREYGARCFQVGVAEGLEMAQEAADVA